MTYKEVLQAAQGQMGPCRACPVCNGRACGGTIPGPGAKGSGTVAVRNFDAWRNVRLNMDTIHENFEPDTSLTLFGRSFKYPFFAGPVGAMTLHYGDKYNDLDYNNILVPACAAAGIAAFTGDGTNHKVMEGAAAAITACGGSASTAASTESTAASAADATADSDLAYIKNKGKMTIGYTVYEPMNYTDADGNFTGFDTELATAVCEKLGVEPDFVEINWDTKIVELDAKSIDCIWNGMTLTDDIMANTACTKAYAKNAQVVVMKADADYSSTADLVGKTIVAEAGSAGESAISEDESLSQADYVSKSVQTDCLMEVAAGTADAAVLDLTLATAMIGEGTDYANLAIKNELNAEEYGVAFRKGSDAAEAVNAAFDELKADGTMQALADKYSLTLAD